LVRTIHDRTQLHTTRIQSRSDEIRSGGALSHGHLSSIPRQLPAGPMMVLPVRVEHVLDVAVYRLDRDGDGLSLRGGIAAARPLTGTLDDFRRFYF